MRLTEIKLAGFKSFVDPTTVHLRGSRVAVVGPNGCGKSNVIDAVRWVMGESSARQLRAEALADVIFNGSSARMPTSMASIELVFDNRDGRAGGELAQYSEISIRREVSREAQSTYYLNGTRCRRRDIADVFLGTGFGPRSYSIIEQGMITELVEAKPEDLRTYLEEAAGVSRYKERRRETRNRIRHTVENLERLNDIRDELDRQLATLKRQANAAARYRALKEDERRRTAELLGIRIRQAQVEWDAQNDRTQSLAVALEAAASERQAIDTALDGARTAAAQAGDEIGQAQTRSYQLSADARSLEQTIRTNRQRSDELQAELAAVGDQRQDAERQFDADAARIAAMREDLAARKPKLADAAHQEADAERTSQAREADARAVQGVWETFGVRRADNARELEVCRQRMGLGSRTLVRLRARAQQLEAEAQGPPETGLEDLARRVAEAGARVAALAHKTAANEQASRDAADALTRCESTTEAAATEVQRQRRELAALTAAQEVALGKDGPEPGVVADWLAEHDLLEVHRLGEALDVDAGWEQAVETVLGTAVQALLVADDDELARSLESLDDGRLTLRAAPRAERGDDAPHATLDALQDYVREPCGTLLAGVFAAPTVAVALRHRGELAPGQSIVTKTGVWLGVDWLRVDKGATDAGSVIGRGRAMEAMRLALDETAARLADSRRHHDDARRDVAVRAQERERLQREHAEAVAGLGRAQTEHDVERVRVDEAEARQRRNLAEQRECNAQIQEEDRAIGEAREQLAELVARQGALAGEEAELRAERVRCNASLEAARAQARELGDVHQSVRLAYQSLQATLAATEAGRERMLGTRRDLEQRADRLLAVLADVEAEQPLKQQTLEHKLTERVSVDDDIATSRRGLEQIESRVRDLTTSRAAAEARVEQVRDDLEAARVERERLAANRDNLRTALAEAGFELSAALQDVPDDPDETAWAKLLDDVKRRIARLGAINLAAIDQYEKESERKDYLDRQHADLEAALATLRGAIRRIDTDSRSRFKAAFEEVNRQLKTLFPRVFRGGHAYLELIGDDWLDTGVRLMARPPGKRNSSIHSLSGGEKAMTAVALIFAIFQLNPSPVCLLDEVDAPLDDTNVARFAELIRDMSKDVQFVVITHNKQTIEMADCLLGVTMQEAGVSRLVSVDVESATRMVAPGLTTSRERSQLA